MSFRRGYKFIVFVGFLICFSCIGILYGNLSSSSAESHDMLDVKNKAIEQLKKELEDRDTKKFTLENKILTLEREVSQCSEHKKKAVEKSDALKSSLDDLSVKAAEVEGNLRKLEQRSSDQIEAHNEDLKSNLDTLEDLRAELLKRKEATDLCVEDLSTLKGHIKQTDSQLETSKIELEKCLQGAGQLKELDHGGDDVQQHQVQAPIPPAVPKPQQMVDSVDHNAPAPVLAPAPEHHVAGNEQQGNQIAALPNAIKLPPIGNNNQIQPQLVGAAPPPLQPAQQPQDQELAPAPLPAQPQELQAAPQHP